MTFEERSVPESVALVALGNSKSDYVDDVCRAGSRQGVADEVWVVNKLADLFAHDVLFRMDDLMEPRQTNYKVISDRHNKNIHERFDPVLRAHPGPIITSKAYPEYPGSIEYPLEKVINYLGYSYFATTPAYAVAFASMIGVKHLLIYGCDYNYYWNATLAEEGRGNMEFVLALCMAKGLKVSLARNTSLLNRNVPIDMQFYGYKDLMEVKTDENNPSVYKVVPRKDIEKMRNMAEEIDEIEAYRKLLKKYGFKTLGQLDDLVREKQEEYTALTDATGKKLVATHEH